MRPRQPSSPATLLTLALILLASLGAPAAKTIFVDASGAQPGEDGSCARPFRTLRSGTFNARAGDLICVAPGTYVENVGVPSGATLAGQCLPELPCDPNRPFAATYDLGAPCDPARIDPNAPASIISATGSITLTIVSSDPNTRVDGFTITKTPGAAGAGMFLSGNPTICNNIIEGNRVSGFLTIGGSAEGAGIGIVGSARVTGNVIRDNVAVSGSGGGIAVFSGSPVITRNVISGNSALIAADGFYGYGGGIALRSGSSTPVITSNIIVGNRADQAGGGIDVYRTQASISGNTFADNRAGLAGRAIGHGGAIEVVGFSSSPNFTSPDILNNLILDNEAAVSGGGVGVLSAAPFLRGNNFFGNLPDHVGGMASPVGSGLNVSIDPNLPADPSLPAEIRFFPGAGFPGVDTGYGGIFCLDDTKDLTCPAPLPSNGPGSRIVRTADLGTEEFSGLPRILDGNRNGVAASDTGAYEVVAGVPGDLDADQVPDDPNDNCPTVYNPADPNSGLQLDGDADGVGYECDNCPSVYNPGQEDIDRDSVGDACDVDKDNDKIPEDVDGDPSTSAPCIRGATTGCDDNCPSISNGTQLDQDGDGVGDDCDNCTVKYNPSQADVDGDLIGDACDNCPCAANGNCLGGPAFCNLDGDPNTLTARENDLGFQRDRNGNGIGDACETDLDADKVLCSPPALDPNSGVCSPAFETCADNCPDKANAVDPNTMMQLDTDGDGLGDACDNCPMVYNPPDPSTMLQADLDGDGKGDACDDDVDGDGALDNDPNTPLRCPLDPNDIGFDIYNPSANCDDNCPRFPNHAQTDTDHDGCGDACEGDPNSPFCDGDIDGDAIPTDADPNSSAPERCTGGATAACDDNCPSLYNPAQVDLDGDLVGDDPNGPTCDNCPGLPNTFQDDRDGDGVGDACEDDLDSDGIPTHADPNNPVPNPCTGGATTGCDDNCPSVYNPTQEDSDADGVGTSCDDCKTVANPADPNTGAQADADRDGIGDACDVCPAVASSTGDGDNDRVADSRDNCPCVSNPTQGDIDRDGCGDACEHVMPFTGTCDGDVDGDGIPDDPVSVCPDFCAAGATAGCADNCPEIYNPTQRDRDGDGFGDACDRPGVRASLRLAGRLFAGRLATFRLLVRNELPSPAVVEYAVTVSDVSCIPSGAPLPSASGVPIAAGGKIDVAFTLNCPTRGKRTLTAEVTPDQFCRRNRHETSEVVKVR